MNGNFDRLYTKLAKYINIPISRNQGKVTTHLSPFLTADHFTKLSFHRLCSQSLLIFNCRFMKSLLSFIASCISESGMYYLNMCSQLQTPQKHVSPAIRNSVFCVHNTEFVETFENRIISFSVIILD